MSLNLFVLLNLFLKMYCRVVSSLFSVGFEMAPFHNLVFVHPKSAFASQALKQYVNWNMIKSLHKHCRVQSTYLIFMHCLPLTLFLLFCCIGMRLFFLAFIVVLRWKICAEFVNQYMIHWRWNELRILSRIIF